LATIRHLPSDKIQTPTIAWETSVLSEPPENLPSAIGASDAQILNKEYAEVFSENDLVNLLNFQTAIKITIDDQSTRPFLTQTLPLPKSVNQNRKKVITVSRERWSKKK